MEHEGPLAEIEKKLLKVEAAPVQQEACRPRCAVLFRKQVSPLHPGQPLSWSYCSTDLLFPNVDNYLPNPNDEGAGAAHAHTPRCTASRPRHSWQETPGARGRGTREEAGLCGDSRAPLGFGAQTCPSTQCFPESL